jgi:hypothetical protein
MGKTLRCVAAGMVSTLDALGCLGEEPRALTERAKLTAAHREAILDGGRGVDHRSLDARTRRWLDAVQLGSAPVVTPGVRPTIADTSGTPGSGGHATNWRRTGRACGYSRHPFAFKK